MYKEKLLLSREKMVHFAFENYLEYYVKELFMKTSEFQQFSLRLFSLCSLFKY